MSDGSPSTTPACTQCVQLQQRIADLEALVRELQERLNQNSSNSSIPPSANPLSAPKPVLKNPTGRKPGGQRGHPGHHRHRIPLERVKGIVPYVPTNCAHCQTPLPVEPGPNDPEPTWHQVAEIPELAAEITEHQGHARTCTCCGHLNRGEIPPGDPRSCHRATLGCGDVLSQRSPSSEPTGGGRGRRDGFRCADLAGLGLCTRSRDKCRIGQFVSRGPGSSEGRPGQECRRDQLERKGTKTLAVDGGDHNGRLFRNPSAAQLQGSASPLGRDDNRRCLQRSLVGLQQAAAGITPDLLGTPETRLSEARRSRRTR